MIDPFSEIFGFFILLIFENPDRVPWAEAAFCKPFLLTHTQQPIALLFFFKNKFKWRVISKFLFPKMRRFSFFIIITKSSKWKAFFLPKHSIIT